MAHESAFRHCRDFFRKYVTHPGKVLDVGGDGGVFEEIADDWNCKYFTLDIGDKAFYDVSKTPYNWPIPDNEFDYVISSSTLEHVKFFWQTFREMCRVCKPGGYIYINAPSSGPAHWSWDGWRFYEDSAYALAEWGGVEVVESVVDTGSGCDEIWHDFVAIWKKPTQ